MRFKDESLRGEYHQTPTLLQVICSDFEELCHRIEVDPVVTRVFEHVEGDSGVHAAHRAVDFRDEHEGRFVFTAEQRASIAKAINEKYHRNDGKPTLLFHSFKRPDGTLGPMHAHVQMALNPKVYATRSIEKKDETMPLKVVSAEVEDSGMLAVQALAALAAVIKAQLKDGFNPGADMPPIVAEALKDVMIVIGQIPAIGAGAKADPKKFALGVNLALYDLLDALSS